MNRSPIQYTLSLTQVQLLHLIAGEGTLTIRAVSANDEHCLSANEIRSLKPFPQVFEALYAEETSLNQPQAGGPQDVNWQF